MRLDSILVRKPASAWTSVGWLLVLMASILWQSCLQADTSKPPGTIVRQLLTERLISKTPAPSLQEDQITSAHARAVLHDNLDPGLLDSVMETTGTDFRFVQSGQDIEAQVGILVLSYPDRKTVLSMAKKLVNMGGYFKPTKVLIPFSCASVDERLVIAFTENAGNEDVVRFIDEFPELFKAYRKRNFGRR